MGNSINSQSYWQFSCDLYNQQGIAETCLYWQDEFQLNVNLLLLAVYLQKADVQLDNLRPLLNAANEWQQKVILPLRDVRRFCKPLGNPVYEQAKQLELSCEQVEQQKLFAALPQKAHKLLTENGNLNLVQQHYQLPLDERYEQFLISINSFHLTQFKA